MRERCVTCKYFLPLLHDGAQEGDVLRAGMCRRRSPKETGFPRVLPIEWCGEYALDPSRLEPIKPGE